VSVRERERVKRGRERKKKKRGREKEKGERTRLLTGEGRICEHGGQEAPEQAARPLGARNGRHRLKRVLVPASTGECVSKLV
jgi:hypothetical protein